MNNDNTPTGADEVSRTPQDRGPAMGRRRFAKGMAPVVLGSLVSQPVLGQVPYHCTVSGNLSGNISYRVGQGVACSTLGGNPAYWLAASSWGTYTKGTAPSRQGSNACDYNGTSSVRGTGLVAAGFTTNRFWQSASGSGSGAVCNLSYAVAQPTGEGAAAATMLQVLTRGSSQGAPNDLEFEFAAIAIASLLSASNKSAFPNYPLTPGQVQAMYNSTFEGGVYLPGPSAPSGWDRAKVAGFLLSLMSGYSSRNFQPLML